MKIKTSPIGFVLLAVLSILVSTKVSNAQSLIETTGATGISNTLDGRPVNPPQIREKIRADLDSKMQNAKNNQEFRNQMIENGYKIATTSPRGPLGRPPMLQKMSSTSTSTRFQNMKERIEDRQENRQERMDDRQNRREDRQDERQDRRDDRQDRREQVKEMALDNLKQKRDEVTKNLDIALRNLSELRKRIQARVEKDRNSNKDMSSVNNLLKIADEKLAIAKSAVDAVKAYKPENSAVSTTTANCTDASCPAPCLNKDNASSTAQQKCKVPFKVVALGPVRELVEKAQLSIKDAHRALNDSVVALAKISGMNPPRIDGRPGTTTPPVQTPNASSTNQ